MPGLRPEFGLLEFLSMFALHHRKHSRISQVLEAGQSLITESLTLKHIQTARLLTGTHRTGTTPVPPAIGWLSSALAICMSLSSSLLDARTELMTISGRLYRLIMDC